MPILLEIPKSEEGELKPLKSFNYEVFLPRKFGGGEEFIQALITLSAVSIPVIGKIIIERIKANKHIVIISKGKKITGLNAKNAIMVLQELHKDDGGSGK